MPINFIDRNNRTVSLQEFDSTDHLNEVGIPISSAIVGSVKFEIKGSAGYIDSNGGFNSPTGYVKITQGNTQKYYDITAGRGITLFVFSGDLHLRERVQYDTHANGNSGLISKLQTINNNFIYILASADAHPMDNDLKNCLNAQFGCNITTTYGSSRRGFALIYAGDVCAFQFSNSENDVNAYTILTRYLGFVDFKCVSNSSTEQANIYNFSIHNGITYDSNKTYKIRVRFRTRGDGNSTSSKCSSVGFITWNADWSKSYRYIHSSNQAYSERGKIVDWTFTFRPSSDYIAVNSDIFYIINNGWANGYDNQTIDLYYYKFWSIDSSGKETKISEAGNGAINVGRYGNVSYNTHSLPSQRVINFIKNNKLYYSVLCSTILDTSYGSQSYRNTEPYNKRIATINYSTSTYGTFNANLDGNRHLGLVSLTKSYASNNQQVYKRTITYNGNGGSVNPSSYSNYFKTSNPSITVNSSASRAYYSLVRWNSKQDNTGTAYNNGTAYNFGSDTTLYAIWKALAYSITYNLNGGTNSSSNPTSYTVESNTITFANPTRPYYTFQGWTLSSIPKGSNGNKSTTANWKRTYALYSASSSVSESVSGSDWRTHTFNVTFAFSLLENGVNSNASSNFSLSWDMPNTYGLGITKSDKIVSSNLAYKVYTLTASAQGGNAGAGSLLVTGQLKDMKNNVVIGSFRFYTSSDWYKSSSGGGSSGGGGSGGGRE